MRIKYIIPLPLNEHQVSLRADQIPRDILGPDTVVECVPVRNGVNDGICYYEDLILDMYITEAGLRAEDEGYDAVIMDTVSDSGLYALRSRLSIPVIGPGLVSYCVAAMLGKKFSIITMWDPWKRFYEKNLDTYQLWSKCASIRSIDTPPDAANLLGGKEDEIFPRLVEVGRRCVEEDGADIILLGSTTMHQAAAHMSAHLPAFVINPGPVAIKITESLVQLGLAHSPVAFPPPAAVQDEKFFSLVAAAPAVGE